MCVISDKIKLCTCKVTSTGRLQHYWVLNRRNLEKNIMIVGEVMIPFEWIDPNYKKNYVTLENRINEGDVFDIPITFKTKDVLELVFNNQDYSKRIVYMFHYSKKKWKKSEIDLFHLKGHFDEMQFGKIKK